MKTSDLLREVEMKPVSKGRRIRSVGSAHGYLVVRFWGSDATYIYGPNIPEAERDKLLRVPFPDSLYTKTIKEKYQHCKVEGGRCSTTQQ